MCLTANCFSCTKMKLRFVGLRALKSLKFLKNFCFRSQFWHCLTATWISSHCTMIDRQQHYYGSISDMSVKPVSCYSFCVLSTMISHHIFQRYTHTLHPTVLEKPCRKIKFWKKILPAHSKSRALSARYPEFFKDYITQFHCAGQIRPIQLQAICSKLYHFLK